MLDYWNVEILGMKSVKHHFTQIMLNLYLLNGVRRTSIFCFHIENTVFKGENQSIYKCFDFLFPQLPHSTTPEPIISKFQYFIIPIARP